MLPAKLSEPQRLTWGKVTPAPLGRQGEESLLWVALCQLRYHAAGPLTSLRSTLADSLLGRPRTDRQPTKIWKPALKQRGLRKAPLAFPGVSPS